LFKILQIKYIIKITIYSINLFIVIYFYINTSEFKIELTVIQFRRKKSKKILIEISVFYNLFIFLLI